MRTGRFGSWLPALLAVMVALDGWLTIGPLTQSTLVAAAALRRLRGKVSAALGRTSDVR